MQSIRCISILASNNQLQSLSRALKKNDNLSIKNIYIISEVFNPIVNKVDLTILVKKKKINKLKFLFVLKKLLFSQPEIIFVGDIQARYMQVLIFFIRPKKLVLLDDGFKSVSTFNRVKEHIFFSFPKKNIFYESLYLTSTNIKPFSTNQEVRFNEKKQYKDEIWFYGQPIFEEGLISQERFFGILKTLSEESNILYFPHPRESLKKFQNNIKNLSIYKGDMNSEEFFIKSKYLPIHVTGFFSTCYLPIIHYNKSSINKVFLSAYYLKRDRISDDIYNYLKKHGVKINE